MKQNGYLTVYLSLTLAILLSFILTLVEGARISATRMRAVCVADIGISSTLAEYNRELLKQYDLLFVDMTYGTGNGSIASVNEHLNNYLKANLDNATPPLSRDLLGMKYESAVIEEYALATDNDAEAVRRQVNDYMKTTLKGALISGFDDLTDELCMAHYDYDIESDRSAAQEKIDSVGEIVTINEEGDEEVIPINNPADAVNSIRSGGILGIVSPDASSISTVTIDSSQYVSNREIRAADGISDEERSVGRAAGQLEYDEYIFDKFGYYGSAKPEGLLEYQIEYIIKNDDCDWDNLEKVCKTISFWRECINYVYLLSDSGKKEEAKAMATLLACVIFCPELEDSIATMILLAWAYVESLQDIRILLEGGGVPVFKSADTWHTSLSDILHPRSALSSYPNQRGPKYGDYLKTMLLMTSYSKVIAKSMDVMEMDIRKTSGNEGFKMDYCLQSFLSDILIGSTHGHRVEIRRRNGYYYA